MIAQCKKSTYSRPCVFVGWLSEQITETDERRNGSAIIHPFRECVVEVNSRCHPIAELIARAHLCAHLKALADTFAEGVVVVVIALAALTVGVALHLRFS